MEGLKRNGLRAVIVCRNSAVNPWGGLSPLVDRPFVQHVVETVAAQGIRDVVFVLDKEDSLLARELGDGTRWGARFRYYSITARTKVYQAVRRIGWNSAEPFVLIGEADMLPVLSLAAVRSATTLFCWNQGELRWTGWGLIRCADLAVLAKATHEDEALGLFLKLSEDMACVEGIRPLMARSYEDLLESNRRVLLKEFPGLLVGGKEVQPGLWMARNVNVHPTARLAPPAFLGENCRIGALVNLGPAVSIGKGCLIERETNVVDSVVYEGSYVGRHLALRNVVVDKNRLVNPACAAEIEGVDEVLLGSVFGAPFRTQSRRIFGRTVAALALAVCLPILALLYLAALLGSIPALQKRLVVRTPSVTQAYRWKTFPLYSFGTHETPLNRLRHFFLHFLPGLVPIAAGYMGFSGPSPLTKEELEKLSPSRRTVYLHSRCGILQPRISRMATSENAAGSDIPGTGWRETAALVANYAWRVVRDCVLVLAAPVERRRTE